MLPRTLPLLFVAAIACERYEAPPEPVIEGGETGVLEDSRAPLVIRFGTEIDPATLRLAIVHDVTDAEGNLADEDADPQTQLDVLLRHDPTTDFNTRTELTPDRTAVVLTPARTMPVGPKLLLLVEPGLRSRMGRTSNRRVKIPFSYGVKCTGGATRLESGRYFMLFDVERPVGLQIQIFADLTIDPTNGALTGRFTSGDRRTDLTCPTACSADTVCRLLPAPACALPSEIANDVEEHTDFAPNPTPPIGFSFVAAGCAADDGEGTGVLTAPATMAVEQPPVTAEGLVLTARFAPGPDGVVRASGTLTADRIVAGATTEGAPIPPVDLGAGTGKMTARRIP
ncbi:MAG: hypothetical protein KIT84_15165 [Labilithrix sp.]|nr:hypothetical protein [Labilithrix sp.]MCW5812364.1 hypothetical protein [Labilithrix sp.]